MPLALSRVLAVVVVFGAALVVPMAEAGAAPSPPPRPTTGFGSSEHYVSSGATEFATGNELTGTKVWWFVPDTLRDGTTAPVVVLLHGFALLAPDIYQGHIDHLTAQGVIVVYPQFNQGFPGLLFDNNQNTMRSRAIAATNTALGSIGAQAGSVHLYGHSLGALIAATWTAAGGPAPTSVTLANASTGAGGPFGGTGINWPQDAPATTAPTILLTGSADTIAAPQQTLDLFDAMTGASSRVVHQARTDNYGSPGLDADHMAPIQDDGIIPSFMMDFLGGDGEDDAMDHRFYQAALDAAIAGQRTLVFAPGQWSDGRAVTAPVVLAQDLPPDPVAAVTVTKATTATAVRTGEAIDYTITITNVGDLPIADLTVDDPAAPDCSRSPGALDPLDVGESTVVECSFTPTTLAHLGGYVNVATVDGSPLPAAVASNEVTVQVEIAHHRFVDVAPWADEAVDWISWDPDADGPSQPVATGFGDSFRPGDPLTRAQIARMLYRLAGEPSVEGLGHPFGDVPAWADAAVTWAYKDAIVAGFDGEFRPGDPLNRAQLARMLYRLAGEPSVVGQTHPFEDVPVWADAAVTWAFNDAIVAGFDGEFRPFASASRAQVARMLHRLNLDLRLVDYPAA